MTDPTASGFVTFTVAQIEQPTSAPEGSALARLFEARREIRKLERDKAALQEGYRIISEEQQQRIKYWRGRFEELEERLKLYE